MSAAVTAEFIRRRLANLPEVMPDLRLLVLFGSAARDRARSESDIDLAGQCDGPADLDAFYLALAPRLGTDRLDLIDLRRAGPLLGMTVARVLRCGTGGSAVATPTKTIRLRPKLRAEIERIARRTRRSFSEVAQTLLEEAVRTQACPGIYFADEPAGRVAKVAGTGLGVWEVIRAYKGVKGNEKKLKKWLPHVSSAQLKAALFYYGRFPQEVDAEIADNVAAYAEGRAMQEAIARRV